MKKIALILLMFASACSKDNSTAPVFTEVQYNHFYSRVRFFQDGRSPVTDTVWTLKLVNREMQSKYENQCGYIYEETSTYFDLGICWKKPI